jgi:hypothetical protein
MTGAALIHSLRQLDSKDRKSLSQLVENKFFNKRKEVALLCNYLLKNLDRAEPRLFTAEQMFKAAFPGMPYNNLSLRHALSFLMDLLRRYLALTAMEEDPAARHFLLCKGMRRRGMDDQLGKEYTRAMDTMSDLPERDALWHLNQYRFIQEELEAVSTRERSSRIDLRPLHDHLTAFYLAEMLRHACSAMTHQAISAQAYDNALLEQALSMALQGDWLGKYPPIALYFHACNALRYPEQPGHFDAWKITLEKHAALFSAAELRSIYLLGINFCIRRINQGEKHFVREAFDLYRSSLEKEVLTENGWLSGFTFKNIIRISTGLGEYDWTEHFFSRYKQLLHPREREAVFNYNQAFMFFHRQDYTRAMPLLQQLHLDDTLNALDARRMLLRSYFELGEWSALDSLLNSFNTFLRRQKDLGYHRDLYLNLVRFTRRLMEMPPGNKQAREKMRKEIEASKEVAEKYWLLEKTDNLS